MKTNKILIIDLEATCWDDKPKEYTEKNSEIIEVGICLFDTKNKKVLKNEGILVKPESSEISPFCTKLTTITPEMVSNQDILSQVLAKIKKDYNPRNYTWGSWGYYDLKQLKRECLRKGVSNPFMDRNHINLKTHVAIHKGLPKGVGIEKALELLNIDFEGTPHRGVDDTLNIARILQRL